MLKSARNTLASIEESAERLASAGDEARPLMADLARDVHRTCIDVQQAAQAHRRTADLVETLLWGIVAGVALWYAYDSGRELVRAVVGLSRE